MIKESCYYYYYRLTYLRMCPYDVNNNITKRPSTTNAIITPLTLTQISFAQTMRRLQQEEAYICTENGVSCLRKSVIAYSLNADSGRYADTP